MIWSTSLPLRGVGVVAGLLELAEQLADLLVVVLEQHDGVGGHVSPRGVGDDPAVPARDPLMRDWTAEAVQLRRGNVALPA